jgi:hypothetical protein
MIYRRHSEEEELEAGRLERNLPQQNDWQQLYVNSVATNFSGKRILMAVKMSQESFEAFTPDVEEYSSQGRIISWARLN